MSQETEGWRPQVAVSSTGCSSQMRPKAKRKKSRRLGEEVQELEKR